MSDLRLFNLKKANLETKTKLDKHALQAIISAHGEVLLGITVIANDLNTTDNPTEKVETLGYDENFRLTIIEYRSGKFGGVVSKGLMFLDYIANNQGKIKSLVNEKLGYDKGKQINYAPRLVIIGEDFNKYDEYAIKQMPYIVELLKYQLFEKQTLVLEKIYQSKNTYGEAKLSSDLINQIRDFTLSLGDEVCEEISTSFICFRKIKAFAYLLIQDGLTLSILQKGKYKQYQVRQQKDIAKVEDLIEQSYDEN